jgi:phosphatidylglycerophosphate synthase
MNIYVNPANAITVSRYLTLPLFVYWLDRGDDQFATLAIIVCGVLDLFDGAVARALRCTSGFGELLDAVTDAICYGFFLAVLVAYGRLPWVPVAGILVLGVVNAALRAVYARRLGKATNYRSYAMERLLTLVIFLAGFGVAGYEPVYYAWVCLVLVVVVVAYDAKRMLVDPLPVSEVAT